MAATFANSKQRVEAEPVWLLHQYHYRETSLIIDVLSRRFGRISLVARGARRPGSALRGNLMAFQPLLLSWFGAGELKTLHKAEWQGGVAQLVGLPLICGFYLNELIIKLVQREDPHPGLFDAYGLATSALAETTVAEGGALEPILRRFEMALLAELGYGLTLHRDLNGLPVDGGLDYRYIDDRGFSALAAGDDVVGALSGRSLLAMHAGNYRDAVVGQQAKWLMRHCLARILGDATLHTRKLLRDLHSL